MTDKAVPLGRAHARRIAQIFEEAEAIQARGSTIDTKHRRSVDHLDQQLETVWAGSDRGSRGPKKSVLAMRHKGRRSAHHVEVVECAIFATPNSLKSQAARNIKSPFSNIRAVTSKLCTHSPTTAINNHAALDLRLALNPP